MNEYFGNNLSGIRNIDDYGMGAVDTPWGIYKHLGVKRTEEVKNIVERQLETALVDISAQRKQAIQNAKIAITKERKADIEATLATYQAEINKRLAELNEALSSGLEESKLARVKIITDRELKLKALQDKILKDRAEAMEIAANAAKSTREEIISAFNMKIKNLGKELRDEQTAYQIKNDAFVTKQKADILAEREVVLKAAVAEAKMARDVILKDMLSNLKTQLDLVKMERKEVVDSLKKEFADAITVARTAREELEARRMAAVQQTKAEMLEARKKAISDLYSAVEVERNKIKAEAISYTNKTINDLKVLSNKLINDAKAEARSGIVALKTERQKALEQTRLQMISERQIALKAAAEERGKIEKSIGVLEKERTVRIKAEEAGKAKRKEEMKRAVHPMAVIAKYWSKQAVTKAA